MEAKNLSNLAKAVIAVMQEVKGIEKNSTIGSGANAYKGVSDQEVKKVMGEAMAKHGLCILPIGSEPKTRIDRWEAPGFNATSAPQQKQQVFTEITTKYLLLHISGESVELSGYGHGVDSQDKSAGKASTYALKYALLYTFLVPTGKIDDADANHSENYQIPPGDKPALLAGSKMYKEAEAWLKEGKGTVEDIKKTYYLSKEVEGKLKAVK